MKDKNIFVTVVIITKNEEEYISETLNSLLKQDYPTKDYEIIIVDGKSTDKTQEIIKRFQKKYRKIRLFIEKVEKTSQGSARNLAVSRARGEFIAFIDGDCIANKDWLSSLTASLSKESEKDPLVEGVGGIIEPTLDKNWKENLIANILCTFLGSGRRNISGKHISPIPNYNSIHIKKILKKEKYSDIKDADDLELNQRLKGKGYKSILDPKITVKHHQEQSFSKFLKKMFNYGKAQAKVFKKIKKIRYFAVLAPLYFIIVFISLIISLFTMNFLLVTLLILLYLIAILIQSIILLIKTRKIYSLLAIVVYPMMHKSYSLGVLAGFLHEK